MKFLIRYFFKTIRLILGPVVLLVNFITMPKGIERPEDEQQKLDSETKNITLYQFRTCPFCIKVKRMIRRLSLNIEMRDAQFDEKAREELLAQGGKVMVPCLKIVDDKGEETWMYESEMINDYLNQRFAA